MDILTLMKSQHCRIIPAGQRIAAQDGTREMYILLGGNAEAFVVQQGGLASAGVLKMGATFGAKEFLWGDVSTVYRAKDDVCVYVITERSIEELMTSQPLIMLDLLRDATAPIRTSQPVVAAPQQRQATFVTPPQRSPAVRQTIVPVQETKPARTLFTAPTAGIAQALRDAKNASEAVHRDTGGATVRVLKEGFFPEGHKGYHESINPDFTQFVYDKEYQCPCCSKPFKDKRIFQSKLSIAAPVRYDMREFFVDFTPEWYDVVTCPHCFFSMLTSYFSDTKNFFRVRARQGLGEVLDKVALDFEQERDLEQVFARHYLALASVAGYVNQKQLIAKLWGNISWLYEDAQDKEMEKFAACKAADAYIDVFQSTTPTAEQEQIICMTISGMLFRAERKSEIRRWLFNVKVSKEGKRFYADLADGLMEKIKG